MAHLKISAIRVSVMMLAFIGVLSASPEALWKFRIFIYPISAAGGVCLCALLLYRFAKIRHDPMSILFSEMGLYIGAIMTLLHMANISSVSSSDGFTFGNELISLITATRMMISGLMVHILIYTMWRTFRVGV